MWLVAGLGNPGAEYALHRHNIGFMAVDALAQNYNFSAPKKQFRAITQEGSIGGAKALLLKPQTYMNLSGESVGAAMRFYKLEPKNVIVLHDELDLPFGKLRVKSGGGNGGHNGLKSIDEHIGAEYTRVRLGIGHPREVHPDMDAGDYVLSNFSKEEKKVLPDWIRLLTQHFPLLLSGDAAGFMTKMSL